MSLALASLLLVRSLVLLALAPLPVPQDARPEAAVGDLVPDFDFGAFLSGGDGRRVLSEFRGQPVLLVNWTDTDFGRGAADKVQKSARDLVPEGLVLVLRDTHNRSADDIRAAAMRRYPGSPARFVRNLKLPIEYADNGPPPDVALIDVEGRLLIAGSYTVDLGRAEKLAEAELKKRKRGWGEHDAARKARALLYGRDRLAEALEVCEAALVAEPEAPELVAVRDEIHRACALRERAVRYHLEQGECLLARARVGELSAAVAGRAELEERVRALRTELESDEARRELALDEKLASLLKPLSKKGPRAKDVKKLERFAAEAGGTRVGRRAQELARIAALASE